MTNTVVLVRPSSRGGDRVANNLWVCWARLFEKENNLIKGQKLYLGKI